MLRNLLLLVGALLLRTTQADPVHIISFNLEQTVTSSTLQWVPMSSHNTDYLKNAVIAGYQITESKFSHNYIKYNGLKTNNFFRCKQRTNSHGRNQQ